MAHAAQVTRTSPYMSLPASANYFQYRNSTQVMEKVKLHAEQRLRTHLMKRHKVKVNWSPNNGRHEVCKFDFLEDV